MTSTYLIGSLLMLIVWVVLFLLRRDLRARMSVVSVLVACLGMVMSFAVWTKDWWTPATVTRTVVGPEDALFGFAMGGVLYALYPVLFRKRFVPGPARNTVATTGIVALTAGSGAAVSAASSSWVAFAVASSLGAATVMVLRPRLVRYALGTAALVTMVAVPIYLVALAIDPGLVARYWVMENLTGFLLIGIPVEDLLWFFTAGLLVGPLVAFWEDAELIGHAS
jgi:hypothetical protein